MDRYRVGQRVIFKTCVTCPEVSGTVTTITEPRDSRRGVGGNELFAYMLDLREPNGNRRFCAEEWQLAPYYDGDEKSTWSACAWKPNKVTA
jgi:hypothetical protein